MRAIGTVLYLVKTKLKKWAEVIQAAKIRVD
jgi:hypothetical protein